MKKFYMFMMVALLLPLCTFARPVSLEPQPHQMSKSLKDFTIHPSQIYESKDADAPAAQLTLNLIDQNAQFYFTGYLGNLSSFAYEPNSNTLIYVQTARATNSTLGFEDGIVNLLISTNNGATWTKNEIYRKNRMLAMYPSVSVLNPNNATDPTRFKYVVTFCPFNLEETPSDTLYRAKGTVYLFMNGNDGFNGQPDVYDTELAPSNNNPGLAQKWGLNRASTAVSSSKGDYFYVWGMLSPEDNAQYGAYGLAYIDFSSDNASPESTIPPQWSTDIFRQADGLGSSWNAPMKIGTDEDGNVYAMVYNIFRDDPNNRRVPAISKSTDNGQTWSDFIRMPFSMITDFLVPTGHNPENFEGLYPYTDITTVVRGPDQISFFLRLASIAGTGTGQTLNGIYIVEAKYDNGSWSVEKVSDLNSFDIAVVQNIEASTSPMIDSLQPNSRYQELQAAITRDKSAIVLKWIDYTKDGDNTAVLQPAIRMVNHGGETGLLDTIAYTDIFFASRNLSTNVWGSTYNATQDKWYNRGTFIPPMINDLNNVPIIEYIIQKFQNPTNPRVIAGYPYWLQNMVAEPGAYHALLAGSFNFSAPNELIRNDQYQRSEGIIGGPSSIEELPFLLNEVAPNPANEYAVINFSMDMASNVTVTLHNAMGQVVKTYNVEANIGENNLNIVTADINSGAYFYTINVNGKTQTKLLNIIR